MTPITEITNDDMVGRILYEPGSNSYIASLTIMPRSYPVLRSFGNGVSAENWLLETIYTPKILLILTYC